MRAQAPATPGSPPATLDPRVALRAATIAIGATTAIWHLANTATVPREAPGTVLAGIVLGAAQLAWTAWLVSSGSRRCLLTGAAATTGTLLASALVLGSGATGPGGAVPEVTGTALQLLLLALTLTGVARRAPAAVLRAVARAGLVGVALAMCVLVAGGAQDHAHAAVAAPRTTTALLCHLI